jgi:diaminopimelate decarboxylase
MSTLAADAATRAIGYGPDGSLMVDGVAAAELAERFGTPTYVLSETQLRLNYRSLYDAFASRYPEVHIGYGLKAHNSVAVSKVLAHEGCGAECFGLGEMTVAERAGIPPERVWINGSDKTDRELAVAIARGYTLNVDNPEELMRVRAHAEANRLVAKVNLRVKLALDALRDVRLRDYRYVPPEIGLAAWAQDHKFGMTEAEALTCCRWALDSEAIELRGLHHHLKGQTSIAAYFGAFTRELIALAARLREATGWVPSELDLGGGFSYGRFEGYGPAGRDTEVPSLDDYADELTGVLKQACAEHDMPLPAMVLEPGRLVVASAAILLATVGTVKRQGQRVWIHVDASINHVLRAYTGNWYYHIVPVTRSDGEAVLSDVVGPLCDAADILGRDRRLVPPERGDVLAVLDVGAYAESAASNFNTQPRALSAIVRGTDVAVMTERESIDAMLSRQRVPAWLEPARDDDSGH